MDAIASLSKKKYLWFVFGFTAIFAGILMACSPMFTDDYDFAAQQFSSFSEVLDYCLHYGNGRLLGNIGAAYFSTNVVLCTAVRAFMLAGLVVLLPPAVNAQRKSTWLISFLLTFGVAPTMFAEAYSWSSGFQNYVPPVFLALLCLLLWQRADKAHCPLWLRCAAVFLLAAAAQLYVELDSIIFVLATVIALVLSHKKAAAYKKTALCWLIGTAAGGIIMLAIPQLFEREYQLIAFYRHVYLSSFDEMVQSVWTNGLKLLGFFSGDCFLCAALGLGTFLLLKKTAAHWTHPIAYRSSHLIALALPTYSLLSRAFFSGGRFVCLSALPKLVFALLCIGLLAVLICAAAHTGNKAFLTRICVLVSLAVCSIAPMLVVYPAPERTVYLCYTLLSCAALSIFEYLIPSIPEKIQKTAHFAGCLTAGVLSVLLLLQFISIAYVDNLNTEYIETQLAEGSTQISVANPPSDYVYKNTTSYLGHYYYLNEPNDVQFTFTDYASWSAVRAMEKQINN